MTHMSPVATMRRSLPPVSLTAPAFTALLGDRRRLRAAQLDKRTAIARLETAWVAAAEADAATGRGGSVRMDDRETWDRSTWDRYLAAASRHEPDFMPRIKRLLGKSTTSTSYSPCQPARRRVPPDTALNTRPSASLASSHHHQHAAYLPRGRTAMPTAIRLTTMPGKIRKGRLGNSLVLDLFGGSLGQEDITIRKPGDVAPAMRAFGERIRAEHPEASFKILVSVLKGQRKPPGYDAAENAGEFKDRAFMHVETEDGQPVSIPALTAAAS